MTDPTFLKEMEEKSGQEISTCYQCCRCTSGCPVADRMDVLPHRLVRLVILGERERVLTSGAIWTCLQCNTCSVRCPNGIDVTRLFRTLRAGARPDGTAARDIRSFHRLFLESVRTTGRMNELSVILRHKALRGTLREDVTMGLRMALKGRVGLWPHRTRERGRMRELFSKAEEEDL